MITLKDVILEEIETSKADFEYLSNRYDSLKNEKCSDSMGGLVETIAISVQIAVLSNRITHLYTKLEDLK